MRSRITESIQLVVTGKVIAHEAKLMENLLCGSTGRPKIIPGTLAQNFVICVNAD